MRKKYFSPKFEVCRVHMIEDALSPSQPVTEESISTQTTEVTEWDPFFE